MSKVGLCCHFCNSIQWVDAIYDYNGICSDLTVKGKGKIRIVACSNCIDTAMDFMNKVWGKKELGRK